MSRSPKSCALLLVALALAACRHDWRGADAFASAVRCGMTGEEIQSLGAQSNLPISRMESGSPNILIIKPYELDFVHVLLQNQQAVAVQQGNHVAFTTGMEFGAIRMLCGTPQIPDRTFWEYERRTASGEAGPES